jgi:hypothetical protein
MQQERANVRPFHVGSFSTSLCVRKNTMCNCTWIHAMNSFNLYVTLSQNISLRVFHVQPFGVLFTCESPDLFCTIVSGIRRMFPQHQNPSLCNSVVQCTCWSRQNLKRLRQMCHILLVHFEIGFGNVFIGLSEPTSSLFRKFYVCMFCWQTSSSSINDQRATVHCTLWDLNCDDYVGAGNILIHIGVVGWLQTTWELRRICCTLLPQLPVSIEVSHGSHKAWPVKQHSTLKHICCESVDAMRFCTRRRFEF